MKKIVAILLSVVLVVSMLAGCSGKDPIVGNWTAEVDITSQFNGEIDSELGSEENIFSSIILPVAAEFTDDGIYKMNVIEDKWDETIEKAQGEFVSYMNKMAEETIAETGASVSVDEFFELSGISLDDLSQELKTSLETAADEINIEGKYKTENGKLYTSDSMDSEIDEENPESYTIKEDVLTLPAEDKEAGMITTDIVFNRVK